MKVVYTLIFLVLYVIPVSGKCKTTEVEMCSTINPRKGCFCKTCISCPPGYGPSHQCGGRYASGTVITCEPCVNGKNHSDEHSIASCQPCNQCDGKKTLQKCTPKQDAKCSTECRVGYKMNIATDDCLPDLSFKTTPPQQIATAKLTTTLVKTTTVPPNTTPTKDTTTTSEPPYGTTKPASSHLDTSKSNSGSNSGRKSGSINDNHSRDNKIIILSLAGLAVVAIVVCAVLKKKQIACFHHENPRRENTEMVPLTEKDSTSPRSSQELVLWADNLRLKDIKMALRSNVAVEISNVSSTVKGWHAIGEARNLSQSELKAISVEGQKQGTSEGEQLLIKLASCQPGLTLTEFVNILENLKRKDVVEKIKDYYNNENKLINSTAIQIIT